MELDGFAERIITSIIDTQKSYDREPKSLLGG